MTTNRITTTRIFVTALVTALVIGALGLVFGQGTAKLSADATESSVFRFADYGEVAGGWSQLARLDGAVAMELHAAELAPNAPYTAWWVVFNTPEGCSDACNEDDIFNPDGTMNVNPDATISVLWADGTLTDDTGAAVFSAVLPEGRPLGEVVFGPGLVDADAAEVHVVIRSHGPVDTDRLYTQLTSFEPHEILGGTCTECRDTLFAVHHP